MPPSDSLVVALPHGRAYPLHFRPVTELPALLEEASLAPGPCLLVTDENVGPHYAPPLCASMDAAGWEPTVLTFPAGESTKSLDALTRLYDKALALGLSRQTPVLALGGGVIGDLAGFAAATLLRGLPLIQIPTSLIAQADSAIGGKTGINHTAGKNLIGAFHQPCLVLIDTATLSTLSERDYTSGLAEVVKAALIADAEFAEWLVASWDAILGGDTDTVHTLVRRAVSIKAEIVAADEREAGQRMLLNFGHTFGHAIERVTGYGTFTHGEAVAVGMRAALHLSASVATGSIWTGPLPKPFARAEALVAHLPAFGSLEAVDAGTLTTAMRTDKKRGAAGLRFVVLTDLGHATVVDSLPEQMITAAWRHVGARSTPA
ncbi:MAG: 3-dehydroquinate synthase [Rhodothermaceae bacterium]|nr:3-dehydroquinate synthase [Rhodothermaceae bacterium]